ncbi:MAG: AmmeMemoRadiSam system radical SAM enzyme [Planctomycetota bacterium]
MESNRPTRRQFISTTAAALGLGLIASRSEQAEADESRLSWWRSKTPPQIEARHYMKLDEENQVWCRLCFRKCIIKSGERGFCRNRENRGGALYALTYGVPCSLQVDPIEKEPVYHFHPASEIFCIAAAGCNLRCKFCQNYHISQKKVEETRNYRAPADTIPPLAKSKGCEGVSFTYSEPTAYYEYMYDVAKASKAAGLHVVCHTNGGMDPKPLHELLKHVDAVTVDLKSFSDKFYHPICTAELEVVQRTLVEIRKTPTHLEVVNLMITGLNDDVEDMKRMAGWIAKNLGTQTPLHINRFYPAYKMQNVPATPVAHLERAHAAAVKEGLEYVYVGNVPGHKLNSTYCPKCGNFVIGRVHFQVLQIQLKDGKCATCGHPIHGVWA